MMTRSIISALLSRRARSAAIGYLSFQVCAQHADSAKKRGAAVLEAQIRLRSQQQRLNLWASQGDADRCGQRLSLRYGLTRLRWAWWAWLPKRVLFVHRLSPYSAGGQNEGTSARISRFSAPNLSSR